MVGKIIKIKSAYFIAGDDSFSKEKRAAEIIDKILPDKSARDLNFESINCADLTADYFLNLDEKLKTAPFLAEKRVLVLKNYEELYIENSNRLAAYLQEVFKDPAKYDACLILLTKDTVSGGKDLSKKQYSEFSRFCEIILCFNPSDEASLKSRLLARLSASGKTISDEAAAVVIDRANGEVRELESEAEKLITFAGKKQRIEIQDVKYLVSDTDVNEFWDLSTAIISKNFSAAMKIFYNIFDHNRPETACLVVMGALNHNYLNLWNIRRLEKSGMSRDAACGKLGLSPYIGKRISEDGKILTENDIKKAFTILAKADISYKTGRMLAQPAIERIIYNLTAF